MIAINNYLALASILFVIGIFGVFLNKKNIIIILMSIELMLLAVNINLVAFSTYLNDITGQVFSLLVLYSSGCRGSNWSCDISHLF